nr:O-antigen ligase family protein [uncultured Acetatifactor sp.]
MQKYIYGKRYENNLIMRSEANIDGLRKYLILFILLTASFDIFGVVRIAGMTFRISQLLTIFSIFVLLSHGRIRLPYTCHPLLIWLVFQMLFSFRSTNFMFSFGYFCWTVLSIALIFVFYNFVNTKRKADWLLKAFVQSFVLMSFLGVFQWVLGLMGKSFFLTQATFNLTKIPRINGFTYEPSYYSTYLLPGWIFIMYLWENGSALFSKKRTIQYAIIISLALFLSTSRMGWIFMALWLGFRGTVVLRELAKGRITYRKFSYIGLMTIGLIGTIVIGLILIQRNGFDFIVAGLGIGGSSAHSSLARTTEMVNTFQLFLKSPFFGYSLGGVPVRYCEVYNIPFDSGASMCVWVELLAASGIWGITPFIIWFYHILWSLNSQKIKKSDRFRECRALFYAVLFECMILAMNQNILRVYFWALLGVTVVVETQYRKD